MLAGKPSLYDRSSGRMAAMCGACRTAALMGSIAVEVQDASANEEIEISKLPILHRV